MPCKVEHRRPELKREIQAGYTDERVITIEMIVKLFAYFLIRLFFLILSCKICLCILDTSPLSSFANIFSQSVGSLSFSFMMLFEVSNHISMISIDLANAVSIVQCTILCNFET